MSTSASSQASAYERTVSLSERFTIALKVQGKSDRAVKAYVEAMRGFVWFLGGRNPLRATLNDIRAYLYHIRFERGYARRTYNQIFYATDIPW